VNKKWLKCLGLFNLSYLINHMAYMCSQLSSNVKIMYFTFNWSIYRVIVLNRAWKHFSLQIMLFVYVCSSWSVVELKTRFEKWITRNYLHGVSLFHLSYLITLKAYLWSQWTPNVQIKYFMFDLQTTCAKNGLETLFSPHDDIRKCLLDMKHGSTKNAFCVVNNKKWRKWCKFVSPFLFNITYGLPVLTMDTKCQNQVFSFLFVDL
jgi:hypothetical protein